MIWLVAVTLIFATPFVVEAFRKPMNDEARSEAKGKFAMLSKGKTHYAVHELGRGPVFVCVHGLTTPSFVWDGLLAGLMRMRFRVLVYDLYGRGFSDRPDGEQDADFFVSQLEELLERQGITEDVTLCGYSMGGAIATAFAHKNPGMIRRLILLAPAGMGHDLGWIARVTQQIPILGDWLMLTGYPRSHKRGTEAERSLPTSVPGIVDLQQRELNYRGFIPAVLSSLRGILDRPLENEHRELATKSIPVTAIWGERDETIPLSSMSKLTEWNRRVHHHVIDGAGHGLAYTHSADVLYAIRKDIVRKPE